MIITQRTSSENIERENLATHVELCVYRVDALNKRIDLLHERQKQFDTSLASFKLFIIKIVSLATAVLTTTMSITMFILDRLQ
jgi:hypothetical protein